MVKSVLLILNPCLNINFIFGRQEKAMHTKKSKQSALKIQILWLRDTANGNFMLPLDP